MASSRTTPHRGELTEAPVPRLWSGMIAFASFMLVLVGGFHVLAGFVALLEEDYYQVPSADLIISVGYTTWGVIHMALGVGMCLAGSALFFRKTWGRVVAVVVASVDAISNLAFLSAAPVWFALMILIDILVIYAVTVHGDREPELDY